MQHLMPEVINFLIDTYRLSPGNKLIFHLKIRKSTDTLLKL